MNIFFHSLLRPIGVVFFLCFLFCDFLFGNTKPQNGIDIISSNENEFVFSFSPESFRMDTIQINGKTYGQAFFREAVPFGKPGNPNIPCRIFSLGIPPEGSIRVTVLEAVARNTFPARLVPLPRVEKQGGMSINVYQEGQFYQQAGMIPPELCRAEEPEWAGVQRIARLLVFPIRFDAANNIIESYSKIVIRVVFESVRTVQNWTSVQEDAFYRGMVLNYTVARKWQVKQVFPGTQMGKAALSGTWYKIPVSQEGLYKVTGSYLKNHGIDLSSIQTSTLKICNNGGRELPRSLSKSRPDSLIENPILVFGTEDGRFDESDYFLFYGRGITGWDYSAGDNRWSHYNNIYVTKNIYWLGFNDGKPGKRIQNATTPATPSALSQNRFKDRFFFEQDKYNPLDGGIYWLGNEFDVTSGLSRSIAMDLQLPDLVQSDSVLIRIQLKGGEKDGSALHQFSVRFNESALSAKIFYGQQFYTSTDIFTSGGKAGKNTLSFTYSSNGLGSNAYLDWFEIECRRLLKASGGRLLFYSPMSSGEYAYALTDFSSEPLVLDVTRFSDLQKLPVQKESSNWIVTDAVVSQNSKQYFAVQESAYLTPEDIQKDELSDLKNNRNKADLIIVSHRDFLEEAQRLKSLKETEDSLITVVADIQDVYDEFSAGLLDPVAIRDFVRYAFNHWSKRPSYLLLFGDGDFDYRNLLSNKDKNWIPPFENDYESKAYDDWYTYVVGEDSRMDLAVGRITVQTKEQAKIVVDKLIQYQTHPDWGDWKTLITFVGDDEIAANPDFDNETTHIFASEEIAEDIISSVFNLKKIYLTDYPEEMQVEGRRKPKAREDLLDQINRGTLLVNFIGHANADVWAHERIFNHESDLPLLRNADRLPLFYAATCSFAWYDDPDKQSFSEDLLASEGKGAIAVIAASRECNSFPNEALDREFIRAVFGPARSNNRIGEGLRIAKQNTYDVSNNEMYHIIGDPTLRLAIPFQPTYFTEMHPDSFQALSLVSVNGRVGNDGTASSSYQGKVLLKGFDSKKPVTYKTRWGTPLNYLLPGNALFRGEANVENGTFQISFIVPKEITYGSQDGRLSAYFWNETGDGFGARNRIAVGGTADILDDKGPDIRLAFSDMETFVSGGMIHEDPELVAILKDEKTGINLTGEIGHTMTLSVDGQTGKDVTEYFQYDEGNYLQGKLRYPLIGLEPGDHEIVFKAWDNANNSSTQALAFQIVRQDQLRLEEVMNYPNPFSTSTHFTFQLNLNADIQIKIYTVEGRMIRKLDGIAGNPGFNMVFWDGQDEVEDGIANGVYLYRITARADLSGKTVEKSEIGRLLIMR